jgi:hypothetical protein
VYFCVLDGLMLFVRLRFRRLRIVDEEFCARRLLARVRRPWFEDTEGHLRAAIQCAFNTNA